MFGAKTSQGGIIPLPGSRGRNPVKNMWQTRVRSGSPTKMKFRCKIVPLNIKWATFGKSKIRNT